jgi:hypothetical protein
MFGSGRWLKGRLDTACSMVSDRSGQIAIIFGAVLTPAIFIFGTGIDYETARVSKARAQAALDAAVVAAVKLPANEREALAISVFNANYRPVVQSTTTTPTFQTASSGVFSGSVSVTTPTAFVRILGINSLSTSASSGVKLASSPGGSAGGGGKLCVLALDAWNTNGFVSQDAALNVQAPTCEVHVKSTANPAATFHKNATYNVKRTCVSGSTVDVKGGGTVGDVVGLETGCTTANDPIAGTLPMPTIAACTPANTDQSFKKTVTIQPGTYCGSTTFNANPDITFAAGVYVFKGPVHVNGSAKLTGNGVTLYFATADAKITWNGNAKLDLRAPTSGTFANILMYEPQSLTPGTFLINGNSGEFLNGLIYLPSRNVTFTGSSETVSDYVTLVVNRLEIAGNSVWKITPHPEWTIVAPASAGSGPPGTGSGAGSTPMLVN